MKLRRFLLLTSSFFFITPALAEEVPSIEKTEAAGQPETPGGLKPKSFTTGVAKGRDMLSSAISASTLDETDIQKISATSIVEIIGNIPGIRGEGGGTNGSTGITIRGLPLASSGSKFLQLQEDGLPVVEFGDINFASTDRWLRPDLTLSQIQSIRGGSASTFASNSPGGIVNFLSKTGEQEGGAIQATAGLDYDLYRLDFNYGGRLSESWRFNVGGFYREGEGPREIGYTGFKGGQIKANITKELSGDDYIRLYAKYMDDREPNYSVFTVGVRGTNSSPEYYNLPGLDVTRDSYNSPYTTTYPTLDQNNNLTTIDMRRGNRSVVKSIGLETQFDLDGWTITDRFRFAANSGEYNDAAPTVVAPASVVGMIVAGPGATFAYATGPNAGQVITNPAALNGNGLLNYGISIHGGLNNLNNTTNDLRASKVWKVGDGKLTTTAGVYYSSQNIDVYYDLTVGVQNVAGGGNSARVDVFAANGTQMTQGGIAHYHVPVTPNFHRRYDVNYRVIAPYGSVNYNIGKLALGASLRYDTGKVDGRLFGSDLGGGRNGFTSFDINGDGVIQPVEQMVGILPLTQPGLVDYTYGYLSYSVSANYRIAEPLSVFARYSRGARAGADRLLFPPSQDPNTGKLTDPSTAYGFVKQAEAGTKFRSDNIAAYVTAFWASTSDKNFQVASDSTGATVIIPFNRTYSAKGVELETEVRKGPFSLTVGATYTKAKIDKDAADPTLNGNKPRHQADLFFSARPQFEIERFTLGTQINGTTSSFAQDVNLLKQPGYVIVSPYMAYRPNKRMEISVKAFNVFDKLALVQVNAAAIPASGIVNAQTLNGRTVTGSVTVNF